VAPGKNLKKPGLVPGFFNITNVVIPAKAGIQKLKPWTPAFAGVTRAVIPSPVIPVETGIQGLIF